MTGLGLHGPGKGRTKPCCAWCSEKTALQYCLQVDNQKKDFCSEACLHHYKVSFLKVTCTFCEKEVVGVPLTLTKPTIRDYCNQTCYQNHRAKEQNANFSKQKPRKQAPNKFHFNNTGEFNWDIYLKECNAEAAPPENFKQPRKAPENKFRLGMKLEAEDPRNVGALCIVTVMYTIGPLLRLRLDGGDNKNDFWQPVDSPEIHPIGYCESMGGMLQPPVGFRMNASSWPAFKAKTLKNAELATEDLFVEEPPSPLCNMFKVGQKLEALDRKNPSLICPATVGNVQEDKILVSFDGWRGDFDYWCRYDCRDIYPVGYCKENGFTIQHPGNKSADGGKWRVNRIPALNPQPPAPSKALPPPSAPNHTSNTRLKRSTTAKMPSPPLPTPAPNSQTSSRSTRSKIRALKSIQVSPSKSPRFTPPSGRPSKSPAASALRVSKSSAVPSPPLPSGKSQRPSKTSVSPSEPPPSGPSQRSSKSFVAYAQALKSAEPQNSSQLSASPAISLSFGLPSKPSKSSVTPPQLPPSGQSPRPKSSIASSQAPPPGQTLTPSKSTSVPALPLSPALSPRPPLPKSPIVSPRSSLTQTPGPAPLPQSPTVSPPPALPHSPVVSPRTALSQPPLLSPGPELSRSPVTPPRPTSARPPVLSPAPELTGSPLKSSHQRSSLQSPEHAVPPSPVANQQPCASQPHASSQLYALLQPHPSTPQPPRAPSSLPQLGTPSRLTNTSSLSNGLHRTSALFQTPPPFQTNSLSPPSMFSQPSTSSGLFQTGAFSKTAAFFQTSAPSSQANSQVGANHNSSSSAHGDRSNGSGLTSYPTACVYVNSSCSRGPYLNSEKVSRLPQKFGPGIVTKVLKEAVQALINCAEDEKSVFDLLKQGNGRVTVTANVDGRVRKCRLPPIYMVSSFWSLLMSLSESLLLCENFYTSELLEGGCTKCKDQGLFMCAEYEDRLHNMKGERCRSLGESLPTAKVPKVERDVDTGNPLHPLECQPIVDLLERSGRPSRWTIEEVIVAICAFDSNMTHHARHFRKNEMDGKALLLLNREMMMKYLAMKLGPAVKMLSLVERLKALQQKMDREDPLSDEED